MDISEYFNRAMDQHKKGDLPGAEMNLKKAIEMDPLHFECWFRLGIVFDDQHKWEDAEKAYSRTIEVFPSLDEIGSKSPDELPAWKMKLGCVYYNRGIIRIWEFPEKKEEGIRDWKKAAELDYPDAVQGLKNHIKI